MVTKNTSDIDNMLKRLRDLGIEMTEEERCRRVPRSSY